MGSKSAGPEPCVWRVEALCWLKETPSDGGGGSNPAASLERVEVLLRLVYPLDFYPLLVFCVVAPESNLECIRHGYTWEEGKGKVQQMMSIRSWPGEREKSQWTKRNRVSKLRCMSGFTDRPLASVTTVTERTDWGVLDKGRSLQTSFLT